MSEAGRLCALTAEDLRDLVEWVGAMSATVDDSDRIERIRQIEALQSALAAAQATVAVEFDQSQRAAQAAAGVPAQRLGRGIAEQVGLARRVSPWQAKRWLGWAKILLSELPETCAELRAGRTNEWRTMLIARETAVLSREDRGAVDAELAPELEGWSDRRVERAARAAAYRLDPAGAVERARNAEADRRVTLRPAPDTMCRLTGLLPLAAGVATWAALNQEADRLLSAGDPRSRGQIMSDTLMQRVTGQAHPADVPVEINLVMTDETLFGDAATGSGRDEPAWLDGFGPVPAGWARDLAYCRAPATPRWIRRLYRRDGKLVALDSTRRLFSSGQQRFLRLRDQTCRTPWCDAPIRHADHIHPYGAGGRTRVDNGQGLCEACNHARQAPGWHGSADHDGLVIVATPAGHIYRSRAPTLPGRRPPSPNSPLERQLAARLRVA